jgi:hypothetical protein
VSQAEYKQTVHDWVVTESGGDRKHVPGSKPEECSGCRRVEESVLFGRLQGGRHAVEEPVLKVRWRGEVVGLVERVRREVVSRRSQKLRGRWHPLTSAATHAFLERLAESETRPDECGHLEIDCPAQYERVWFSMYPVTGEAWLTCRLKEDPRARPEDRRREHEELSEFPRCARDLGHEPGSNPGADRGCSEIDEGEREVEAEA